MFRIRIRMQMKLSAYKKLTLNLNKSAASMLREFIKLAKRWSSYSKLANKLG